MNASSGKPSVEELDLRPSDRVVPMDLRAELKSATLRVTRGDEAEILITEIIGLTDKLIYLSNQ